MIRDLSVVGEPQTVSADVAVVGAGLAGLALAVRLAKSGHRVVVLESGGPAQSAEADCFNEVELAGQAYKGATEGRFRCLGGTSTQWGGALLPFIPEDLNRHTADWAPEWPVDVTELWQHIPEVESMFGLSAGSYEEDAPLSSWPTRLPSFSWRSPKWPKFASRNMANIHRRYIRSAPNIEIWLNALVTSLNADTGRVNGVSAQSTDGGSISVTAPVTVLAGGAIESTRFLLMAARKYPVMFKDMPLGHYFNDHLSAVVADIKDAGKNQLNQLFSFQFASGGMRNWRMELSGLARRNERLPGGFAHVAFTTAGSAGFAAVRGLAQSVQRYQLPQAADVAALCSEFPWLLRAAWWGAAKRTVLAPRGAGYELHVVTEQKPVRQNRISLSETRCDAFGQPLARIDWNVLADDVNSFMTVTSKLIGEWQDRMPARIGKLDARAQSDVANELTEGGGIYHPAGSTRMGTSRLNSVLDGDLAPHGVAGLRVVSTSAFPNGGGANPSLMLLLFAMRSAKQIELELR